MLECSRLLELFLSTVISCRFDCFLAATQKSPELGHLDTNRLVRGPNHVLLVHHQLSTQRQRDRVGKTALEHEAKAQEAFEKRLCYRTGLGVHNPIKRLKLVTNSIEFLPSVWASVGRHEEAKEQPNKARSRGRADVLPVDEL